MSTSKKILITGGMGFIGSHLAKKCIEKNFEVTILSRSNKKINNIKSIEDKINLIIKDVKDISKKDVKNKDYIFHLAGTTDNYNIQDNPYIDVESNCTGTLALLEACRYQNPKTRIVYGSTFFVNGNPLELPVNPSSPCEPLGIYPATRLAGEHFCKIYNNVFDMNSLIARFTNVFGPFEQGENKKKAGFNYLINQSVKGKEISLYNNGNFFRDYIYVTDVIDACITLAEMGEKSKIYYVGRGEFIKFKKLIDIIANNTNVKINPIISPDFHNRIGIKDFVCNNSDLKNLGWEPKVSPEEGIKKTVEYYQNKTNE